MATLIGKASCPLCGSKKARVTLSKAGLSVLTCNSCNCQLFARSDRSDELLRAQLIPESAGDAPAVAVPKASDGQPAERATAAASNERAGESPAATAPAPEPSGSPTVAAATKPKKSARSSWDVFA